MPINKKRKVQNEKLKGRIGIHESMLNGKHT